MTVIFVVPVGASNPARGSLRLPSAATVRGAVVVHPPAVLYSTVTSECVTALRSSISISPPPSA